MRILVQKFGGTSLSSVQARERAIHHIRKALTDHYHVVAVVSAMGRKGDPYATDTLLDWIKQNGDRLPAREKDLLLCCGEMISAATLCSLLHAQSISSVVLTGKQAGITTNDHFGDARIISVDPAAILRHLQQDQVVIVTGFQGCTERGELTTLGRGGSDTSATAIGAALRAEAVDIFTDVDGIFTTDPRLVGDARPIPRVSYEEICNMAHNGAKVIHPRAVEVAKDSNIPIRVRNTFSDEQGTLVTHTWTNNKRTRTIRDRHVTGIAHVDHITQIEVSAPQEQYDLHLQVFKAMAQHRISVDFINVNPSGVLYTVYDHERDLALSVLRQLGHEPKYLTACAKVAVIGGGMNGVPGIMARIVEALTEEDIRILQSADSNTTIWVLVRNRDLTKAVKALHAKFELDKITG